VFDFKELNETSDNNLPKIIKHIHDRLKSMMDIELNIPNGIKRITDMNKLYTEIKTKPFKYVDPFYQLHGSHRNRK
jgi:Ni,Fe-hydrogenase III large subunit